jgi:SAM-dependent methyltransferase
MVWNSGWDEVFRRHDWGRYPSESLVRFVGRSFRDVPDRAAVRVLEVGCGTGANLWFLAREGFDVYGIDGSKVAVDRARERCEEEGQSVDLRVGDIGRLPYEDACFDIVVDIECLYANSIANTRGILLEIRRVLKPGGRLFSMTFMTGTSGEGTGPTLPGEPNTYLEMSGGPFKKGYGVIRLSTEDDIRDLYATLELENLDYAARSDGDRKSEIREWLVTCRKSMI